MVQFRLLHLMAFMTALCIGFAFLGGIGPFLSLLVLGMMLNIGIVKLLRLESMILGAVTGCGFALLFFTFSLWLLGSGMDFGTLAFGYMLYPALGLAIGLIWSADYIIRECI